MRGAFAPWNPAYMMPVQIQRWWSCLRHSNRSLARQDGIGMTTGADDDPAAIAVGSARGKAASHPSSSISSVIQPGARRKQPIWYHCSKPTRQI
jgi:hypothetical protein